MGKDKKKTKKKCCGKYLEKGKHCKNCPLLLSGEDKGKKDKKKRDKEKKAKKK